MRHLDPQLNAMAGGSGNIQQGPAARDVRQNLKLRYHREFPSQSPLAHALLSDCTSVQLSSLLHKTYT